jgi:hypothetical protein
VDVTRPQEAALQVAELVEQEQRVVTGAAEVAVPGRALLIAVGRALGAVHVEDDARGRGAPVYLVDPGTRQIYQRRGLASLASHSVSKRPIWLLDAAKRSSPSRPTIARIAGSRAGQL